MFVDMSPVPHAPIGFPSNSQCPHSTPSTTETRDTHHPRSETPRSEFVAPHGATWRHMAWSPSYVAPHCGVTNSAPHRKQRVWVRVTVRKTECKATHPFVYWLTTNGRRARAPALSLNRNSSRPMNNMYSTTKGKAMQQVSSPTHLPRLPVCPTPPHSDPPPPQARETHPKSSAQDDPARSLALAAVDLGHEALADGRH